MEQLSLAERKLTDANGKLANAGDAEKALRRKIKELEDALADAMAKSEIKNTPAAGSVPKPEPRMAAVVAAALEASRAEAKLNEADVDSNTIEVHIRDGTAPESRQGRTTSIMCSGDDLIAAIAQR